jgi:mRNA interferase MazF
VARRLAHGEVWLYRFGAPDKRRPVLILSRQDAIDGLRTVMVAPITSTIRGLPSEVMLDVADGMKGPCAANLDHVHTVPQADLRHYVATLKPAVMAAVCRALAIATGCAGLLLL